MLRPYIENREILKFDDEYLRKRLKKVLPNHILYDLRTTFYTRLKECNVADNTFSSPCIKTCWSIYSL